MITIPYTYLFVGLVVVFAFGKMGQIDEEIGFFLGASVGLLAVVLNYFLRWGYGGLVLHVVGGFLVLTVYKTVRGMRGSRTREPEE